MLIDELKLNIRAGKGGDGVVRWRHEKGKEFSGPSGGDGGKGADVFIEATRDIALLARYKHLKKIIAENGQDGMNNSKHGRDGEDLFIKLPIGAVVTNLETKKKFSLERENQKIKILSGGRGGLGNENFKSSTNTRPKNFTYGKDGESGEFFIELEMIADAGLVGLPNAGKTSLINILTNSNHKIGNYEFTTLSPNLGNLFGFILADIPGLIENSSAGKGLGIKFLRHIKRTKILIHCISADNKDIIKAYKTIKKELKDYGDLDEKEEYIVITKTDLVNPKILELIASNLRQMNMNIFFCSIFDLDSINNLKSKIYKILNSKEL